MFIISSLSMAACSHISARIPAGEPALSMQQALKLTDTGDNFQSRFSQDSSNVVYISKDRANTKNQQIYEWSFVEKKERRVTYSDGDVSTPQYIGGDKKIAYLSTTDTIKEHPHLFRAQNQDATDNSDLFFSDVSGIPIEKVTRLESLLSDLKMNEANQALFVIHRGDREQVATLSASGHLTILTESRDHELHSPLLGLKQTLYWIEEESGHPPILHRLKPGKKIELIATPFKAIHDMNWWDQEKETILISARNGDDAFDTLYLFDLRNQCRTLILAQKTNLWEASPNSDRSKITFTAAVQGQRQIYILPTPTLAQCEPVAQSPLLEGN